MNSMSAICLINQLLSNTASTAQDPPSAVNNDVMESPEVPVDGGGVNSPPRNAMPTATADDDTPIAVNNDAMEPPEVPVDGGGANSPPHNAMPAATAAHDPPIAVNNSPPHNALPAATAAPPIAQPHSDDDGSISEDGSNADDVPNEMNALDDFEQPEQPVRLAAQQLIASHPVKKIERLKGWTPQQIQMASSEDHSGTVSQFLSRLFDLPNCFDRVHKVFVSCTCLFNIDRALIPNISAMLGKVYCCMCLSYNILILLLSFLTCLIFILFSVKYHLHYILKKFVRRF